jgi:hypothetical protein
VTGLLNWFGDHAGHRALSVLRQRLATGLAAAATAPALLAAVDQHAAAVRDILAYGVEGSALVASTALLAAYAHGVLEEADQQGWKPPAHPTHWAGADWISLRLLAVCHLAQRPDTSN